LGDLLCVCALDFAASWAAWVDASQISLMHARMLHASRREDVRTEAGHVTSASRVLLLIASLGCWTFQANAILVSIMASSCNS
jgi:hypothetical protein